VVQAMVESTVRAIGAVDQGVKAARFFRLARKREEVR
jgi:hypothetical protein